MKGDMEMNIYKIRYFVNKQTKKGIEPIEHDETIVIENLQRAKEIFKSFKNKAQCWTQYAKYTGKCELFIPHLCDNGELAYWPDNNIYIEQWDSELPEN